MARTVATIVILYVMGLTLILSGQTQIAAVPVDIGILREDRILVPIGRFDGNEWSGGPNSRELQDWELLTDATTRKSIKVSGTTEFENHCQPFTGGLVTNYQTTVKVEPHSYPLPYAGIAATRPGMLEPIFPITNTRERRPFARLLPRMFAQIERDVWRDTEDKPRLDGPLRTPRLDYAYWGPLPDGRELVLVEASRQLEGSRFDTVTRVIAWTARTSAGLRVLQVIGSKTDSDWKGGDPLLQPRAALTVGDRTFWIGNATGYESESYFVLEVTGGIPKLRLNDGAGAC